MTTTATRGSLLGVSLAYFLVLLDTTVLTVALPDIRDDLGGSFAGQQWVVNGYTVSFAAFLLGGGALADRVGPLRVFRWGVAGFGVLSLVSAAAPTLPVLVVLRVLLGIAGAACLPSSLSLISRLHPDPAARAKALGAWAAITGVALATGPIVGGLLVDLAGWRAVFVVNVPLAVLGLALTRGRETTTGGRGFDVKTQLAACVVLGLVTEAIVDSRPLALVPAALVAAVFRFWERRSAAPAVPPVLVRTRAVATNLFAGAAVNFVLSGTLFAVTLLLRNERHLDPVQTGLAFLPLTLPTAFNPLLTSRIVVARGPRLPVVAGLTLLTAGALVLAAGTRAPYPVLACGLLLLGFGVSLALPALVTGVVTAAPDGYAGTAGGLLNAVRQVGATVGVAAMGSVVATGGFGWAFLLAAALTAAAQAASFRQRNSNSNAHL
ncbi:MFS transporter [Amycolatopsis thermophila]|uniref:DHA2 family methylenomycin A resistance protein-like MFS transporter n=1 Tax=Amycolatopsis thermophila TaxID=206084 RepID=A0ABU0EXH3_9PSEU|nr:MFS transporter [Amycolatopsis thermophila]MDQ0380024.1 DHA2 family methylenomycin A resistance protein-like MFS transporter [Amycolatopsis thermophila]